jgi:hypothetical protein
MSRDKITKKAAAAMGAEVAVHRGAYVLCNLVDQYKERTTNYYVCRESNCAGREVPAQNAKASKSRADCISQCRKMEHGNHGRGLNKSYCVN